MRFQRRGWHYDLIDAGATVTRMEPCATACVVRNRLEAEAADLRVAFRVPQPDGSAQRRQAAPRAGRDASDRPIALGGVVLDVRERKRASEPIHHLAHLDVLTGLANRTKLAMSLRQHPGRIKRMDAAMAVLAIDLDRFKAVNDLQGYAAGANWAVCRRR